MSENANVRSVISIQNRYWIEKHRYYELKHFCLQYPIWKKSYETLSYSLKHSNHTYDKSANNPALSDPTSQCAMKRLYYSDRMKMVQKVSEQTDPDLSTYILRGVTEGWSYDILKARLEIPCCRNTYYELYRKFFWLLDKARQ